MPEEDSRQHIPLSVAAAQALARLVPERVAHERRSLKSRNLIALEISALIPVYRRASPSGSLRRVTEAELSAGRFSCGATRFVLSAGGEFSLLVRQSEVEAAIQKLVAEYVGRNYSGPGLGERTVS